MTTTFPRSLKTLVSNQLTTLTKSAPKNAAQTP
jgi:hypothetical protein